MPLWPPVANVVFADGIDRSAALNEIAEAHGIPPVLLVGGALMESGLGANRERYGRWPDVSFGDWQQTVAYAPIGDGSAGSVNVHYVREKFLDDWEFSAHTAARHYATYWKIYGDPLETYSRYNGGAAMPFARNPNRAAIAAAWEQAQQYLAPDEEAPMPDLTEQWIAAMQACTGTPYVFGGKNIERDGGLDCSGLLTSTAHQVGLDLGDPDFTSAESLKQYADQVDYPQRGDLVLFSQTYGDGGPEYATHVGVHLHDTTMLDTHDGVHETDYGTPYWQQHLMGYWRPRGLAPGDDDMSAEERTELADLRNYLGGLTKDVLPAVIAELEAARGRTKADQGHLDRALTALREHAG